MMGLMDFKLGDVGGIFTSLREAITGEKITDPQKLLEKLAVLETAFLKAKQAIIVAEANSAHWVTSAWRPITMLVFVFIIANNYVLVPYFNMFLEDDIKPLILTPDMWELLKIGLGGYIVGRTVEKSIDKWKGVTK